jgi:hypothetical protein
MLEDCVPFKFLEIDYYDRKREKKRKKVMTEY